MNVFCFYHLNHTPKILFKTFLIFAQLAVGTLFTSGYAETRTHTNSEAITRLTELAKDAIHKKLIQNTQSNEAILIQFPSIQKLAANTAFSEIQEIVSVQLIEDRISGVAVFDVAAITDQQAPVQKRIQLPYEAWIATPVAKRRIYPNTKISNQDFSIQRINVATGMAREYRGILAPTNIRLDKVITKNTILEGQFLTTAVVQREPDLKRGEMVKIEMISGDLTLSTQGVTQEPAAIGDRVRVLSTKTKREIVGTVRADRSVEVQL